MSHLKRIQRKVVRLPGTISTKRLLVVVATSLALACDGNTPVETDRLFTGTWVWVRSVGGVNGQERTPATETIAVRLDYDGRRVRAYQDGRLIDDANYTATELPTSGPLPVYSIEYEGGLRAFPFDVLDQHTVVSVTSVIIRFEDPCCDRWTHTLVDAGLQD